MAIKLIVVDDQEVVRKGLASLLVGEDIEIVAEAATGKEAISKTKKHKPDVLLMDVAMQEMDGLDAFERIRKVSPTTKVVMMSLHDNPSYVARAAALGASDFLLKDVPGKTFAAAIGAPSAGNRRRRTRCSARCGRAFSNGPIRRRTKCR